MRRKSKNSELKTAEFWKAIGKESDSDIAGRFGVPEYVVGYERRKLGIPCMRKRHASKKRELKTPEFYQALGTDTDEAIGKLFGIDQWTITYERRRLGIPCSYRSGKCVKFNKRRDEFLQKYRELGTYEKVAEFYGISKQRAWQILHKNR